MKLFQENNIYSRVRFNVSTFSKIYSGIYKDKHYLTTSKGKGTSDATLSDRSSGLFLIFVELDDAISNRCVSPRVSCKRIATTCISVQIVRVVLATRGEGEGFPCTGKHTRISFAYLNT